MALSWGAWQYGGGNGMRLGIDTYNGSGVDTNSTQFSFLADIWTGTQYNYSGDTQALNYSGNVSGSFNFTNNQTTGTSVGRDTKSVVYNYPANSYGTSPGVLYVNVSLSGYYNTGMPAPSHSVGVQVPARPFAPSFAPTGVTATRNSDTQATISGTHPVSAQRPNYTMTIQMQTYTGSTWSAWSTIYNGTGNTYVKTGLSPNHIYKFQMRLDNPAGSSAYVEASSLVYTTPSAPTGVTANPSGSNIVVTWDSSAYVSSTITHKIERKKDSGAWTAVATSLPQATKTWTDSSPGGTNLYRVATVSSTHSGLSSSWVQANEVVLIDCWIWDGQTALPAKMTQWTGTVETPLSIEQQVFRGA